MTVFKLVKLFNELVITKQRRRRGVSNKITAHNGYDTETFQGKAHLICNQYSSLFIDFNASGGEGKEKILNYLCNGTTHKGRLNWFFNLNYDVRAILKWFTEEQVLELYNSGKLVDGVFTIEYLPSKIFTIKRNKEVYRYFDIAQFYGHSLNYNAEKYLGDKKIDTIDSQRLGYDTDYWDRNLGEIIHYCIHDADLTARLANLFFQKLDGVMNFSTTRPYSTGSIAQEYFIQNANIPTIEGIPRRILELHQDGYRGGRIELLKKGYFPSCNGYDIKSAYPSIMRGLLDYSMGEWIEDENCKKVDTGIYRINLSWFNDYVAPFPYSGDIGAIYPNGESEYIVNEKEIEFLRKWKKFNDFEILEGWEFIPYREVFPYRERIDYLFDRKESASDATEKLLYKLFINSIYGKTAQAIDKRRKDSKEKKVYHTGGLWNSIYANRITSLTRLQILDTAMPIIDSVIGFSTDSIHTTKTLKVPSNPVIGDFTEEYKGEEGVFLMAGLRLIGDSQKIRGYGGKVDLKRLLMDNPDVDKIPVIVDKPITIFESLKTDVYKFTDMNVFIPQNRVLDINGDLRRIWEDDFKSAKEVFKRNIDSMPIHI